MNAVLGLGWSAPPPPFPGLHQGLESPCLAGVHVTGKCQSIVYPYSGCGSYAPVSPLLADWLTGLHPFSSLSPKKDSTVYFASLACSKPPALGHRLLYLFLSIWSFPCTGGCFRTLVPTRQLLLFFVPTSQGQCFSHLDPPFPAVKCVICLAYTTEGGRFKPDAY